MANYATLKAGIQQYIKENHNNDITGNLLQQQLLAMVNSLGAGYQYMGSATPSTNPGTPDQNVFYFATVSGTYTNFGGIVVGDNEFAILKYNGSWSKDSVGGLASFYDIMKYVFSGKNIYRNVGYIGTNGQIGQSSGYHYTDFLLIDRNSDIKINHIGGPDGMLGICFYDENFNALSDGQQTPSTTITVAKENIPQNAIYFRSSSRDLEMSDETYISFFTVESLLAELKPETMRNNIAFNRDLLKYTYNSPYIFSVDNTYIELNGTIGSISSYAATDYLPIFRDQDIIVNHVGGQGGSLAIAFYDENKNFISSFDYTNYVMSQAKETYIVEKANIPSNAKYIRSCVQKSYFNENTFVVCTNIYSLVSLAPVVETLEQDVAQMQGQIADLQTLIDTQTNYGQSIFVNTGYLSSSTGLPAGSYSDTKYTNFIPVTAGTIITALLGVNQQMGAICIYTDDDPVTLSRIITGGQFQELTQVQLTATITGQEKFVRLCSSYSMVGTITFEVPGQFSSLITLGDLFDYNKVCAMPKQLVRSMIESASNGLCTVLYDDSGLPSLMYKIPIISLGALKTELGDLTTPHPAFIVNGVQKSCIYMGCFQTSVVNGVPVCWFGLAPGNGSKSFEQIRAASKAKGTGWHLETIYERSLALLLSTKRNGDKPRGNRKYGMDSVSGYEYEAVQRVDGNLPGTDVFAAQWVNGTQPLSWSHNNERFGIFDLLGGYWEWTDLIKVVNGQIYLAADNNFNAAESAWVATGAYMDVDENGVISFNNSFNANAASGIVYTNWATILCQAGYDTLAESLRKKLQQLLICPRLSSQDSAPLFNFDGKFWMKKDQTNYLIHGGAEEYAGCGFGEFAISYPATESHGNMGSRLCYIEM